MPKKKYALFPSERKKECTNHQFIYTGNMPCTGGRICHLCGIAWDDIVDKLRGLEHRAHQIADKAHKGQYRRGGAPFITHPLAVRLAIKGETEFDYHCRIVALLHDVLEDAEPKQIVPLKKEIDDCSFSESVIVALNLMFHSPEDTYLQYLLKLSKNRIARRVKMEDLTHNMLSLSQSKEDRKRYGKYEMSLFILKYVRKTNEYYFPRH